MSTFPIQPIERFATAGAVIKRPREIAHFSYDDDHAFHLDDRSIKYYYTPPLGASLSGGFSSFKHLDDTADEHLDSLLKAVAHLERRGGGSAERDGRVDADLITWRGMMTKIMAAPYDWFNGFEMNAICYEGTIFLEEDHDYKLQSRLHQEDQPVGPGQPSQQLMAYWGYKFETLCLLPKPWDETSRDYIESRESLTTSNYAQYCSVVQTSIGGTKLVLGGEVDAIWDGKPQDPSQRTNWVELKTSAEPQSDKDMLKFERKLNKFWIQSFLLGVPKIVVGFRSSDSEGRLLRLQEFETAKIPAMVRNQGKKSWDSNVCIKFAAEFLTFLKDQISGEGVWKIRKRERSWMMEVVKQEENGYGDILSTEFVNWRKELAKRPTTTGVK